MTAHQHWKPYCHAHVHTNKDGTWNCDHILGKQLFKFVFGTPDYQKLKILWNSPYNKQALPPNANNCAGLLCQRAWLFMDKDQESRSPYLSKRRCYCLDCILLRMLQGKSLNRNLRRGLQFLKHPENDNLECYKSSLCRSLRDLQKHYPQYLKELERVKKRVLPLVCCRSGKFSTICVRCALPRVSCTSSLRSKRNQKKE